MDSRFYLWDKTERQNLYRSSSCEVLAARSGYQLPLSSNHGGTGYLSNRNNQQSGAYNRSWNPDTYRCHDIRDIARWARDDTYQSHDTNYAATMWDTHREYTTYRYKWYN